MSSTWIFSSELVRSEYYHHLDNLLVANLLFEGVWFVQIANNYGANHEYTDEQRQEFRDPEKIVEHAKSIEDQVNGLWGTFFKGSKAQADGQKALKARTAEFIKDERLLEGFTPSFGIGCRRVTPGDPYMGYVSHSLVPTSNLPQSF